MQDASAIITQGLLEEAASRGYEVSDDAAATLQEQEEQKQAEAPAEEAPPEPPDPLDSIIASVQAESAEKFEEAAQEEPDDEETMPDFEAEAEAQMLDEEISHQDDDEWVYSEDRKRAIIAEKRAAYLESQNAKRERGRWEAEARKQWPYSTYAFQNIKATSRRQFLREAKAAAEAVTPFIKEVVAKREAELAAERANLKAEEKAKAAEAWGEPTTPPAGTPNVRDWDAEIAAARRDQDLARIIGIQRERDQAGGGDQVA